MLDGVPEKGNRGLQTALFDKFIGLVGLVDTAGAKNNGLHPQLLEVGAFGTEGDGLGAMAGHGLGVLHQPGIGRRFHGLGTFKQRCHS